MAGWQNIHLSQQEVLTGHMDHPVDRLFMKKSIASNKFFSFTGLGAAGDAGPVGGRAPSPRLRCGGGCGGWRQPLRRLPGHPGVPAGVPPEEGLM